MTRTRPETDLPTVLAHLAAELPAAHHHAWTHLLQAAPGPSPSLQQQLLTAQPGTPPAHLAHDLIRAWMSTHPQPDGPALALALQAAAHAHTTAAAARRADLVVSGPASTAVPVRATAQVITEVIRAARTHLLLVSFAAYRIPALLDELRTAAARGVTIDVILESAKDDGGTLTHDARTAFATLPANFWHWPPAQRPTHDGHPAALHAKLVAADQHTALLGSANLTTRALTDNLEIGILLRNPDLVGRLDAHFRALMSPQRAVLRRL